MIEKAQNIINYSMIMIVFEKIGPPKNHYAWHVHYLICDIKHIGNQVLKWYIFFRKLVSEHALIILIY